MHLATDLSLLRRGGRGFTLDFDAARGVIPAPLSFSRASGGWHWTAGNVLLNTAAGVARFGTDGLLAEGTRATLWTDSQIGAGAGWVNGNVSVTSVDGPDGVVGSARRLDDGVAAAVGHRSEGPSWTTVVSATYTATFIVRPGTCTSCQIVATTAGFPSTAWANFDLTGDGAVGTIGGTTTARIRKRGGWFEISATFAATIAAAARHVQLFMTTGPTAVRAESYTGTNRTLDVFHAWLEEALFPSSPIINSGGVANRAVDVLTAPWASVAPTNECTVLFVGTLPSADLGGVRTIFGGDDGTNNNRWAFRTSGGGNLQVAAVIAGSPFSSAAILAVAGDVTVRAGATFRVGTISGFAAGGVVRSVPASPPVNTFRVGTRNANADPGFIRGAVRCRIIPRSVSDADLQSLVNAL